MEIVWTRHRVTGNKLLKSENEAKVEEKNRRAWSRISWKEEIKEDAEMS